LWKGKKTRRGGNARAALVSVLVVGRKKKKGGGTADHGLGGQRGRKGEGERSPDIFFTIKVEERGGRAEAEHGDLFFCLVGLGGKRKRESQRDNSPTTVGG